MIGSRRRGVIVPALLAAAAGAIALVLFYSGAASSIAAFQTPTGPEARTTPAAGATTPAASPSASPDARADARAGATDLELGFQLSAHHRANAGRALKVMDRLEKAGARWVRVDVGWETLQPHGPGRFQRWYATLLDKVLAGAHERGLKVILCLWQTPPWASNGGGPATPPTHVADYAHALVTAARRWGTDVDAWEIWNEPNFAPFFAGADPATYTRLLCASYRAVKRHDRSPVLFGGLMYNDDAWLEKAYEAGAKGCFDALATHPYVGPSDAAPNTADVGEVWRLTHTPAVRAVMDKWHDSGKRIWITELGWSSGSDSGGNPWNKSVTPRQQAAFLEQAVDLVRTRYPYVGPIIWYRDVDGPSHSYEDGFGLLTAHLTPKPALRAFERAVRR